jgi:hypothetical protein
MRTQMTALVREWTQLGGIAHLPTVEERLKEKRGPSTRTRARYARPPYARPPRDAQKRRLVARA